MDVVRNGTNDTGSTNGGKTKCVRFRERINTDKGIEPYEKTTE